MGLKIYKKAVHMHRLFVWGVGSFRRCVCRTSGTGDKKRVYSIEAANP